MRIYGHKFGIKNFFILTECKGIVVRFADLAAAGRDFPVNLGSSNTRATRRVSIKEDVK